MTIINKNNNIVVVFSSSASISFFPFTSTTTSSNLNHNTEFPTCTTNLNHKISATVMPTYLDVLDVGAQSAVRRRRIRKGLEPLSGAVDAKVRVAVQQEDPIGRLISRQDERRGMSA